MIIATAGHVDHGKTELVRALTGTDTDRLPEEKARGLSIDLGFAYQALPDHRSLGFVDVPGHEKFIRNMLAGIGGIDLGLLVVAADDGVMPQTREHLAILDLLGIDQCVVAITKIDRVDDDRIVEVQHQIETLLDSVGLESVSVYPVCAPDNDGVDALKTALHERAQGMHDHDSAGHFRLAIDRVFTLKGTGLIVTGMVFAGVATIDDALIVSSDGASIRVRGIRAHDQASNKACAGERCAINIAGRGIDEDSVKRGDWLLHPELFAPTRRIDVDLRVLDSEIKPLKHWTPVHLHIGADRIAARVAVLSGGNITAGDRGLAQLVLERDAFVVHGDRFVLRDPSAQRTIAGGHVIDPFSPKRGRARPARIAALEAMNQRNPETALGALAGLSETGVRPSAFAAAHNLHPGRIDAIIERLSLHRAGRQAEERVFSKTQWRNLLDRIEQAVMDFHRSRPSLAGASLNDIQLTVKPYVERPVLESALGLLIDDNRLGRRGARFHLPAHEIQVSDHDRQLWARAIAILSPETGSPPSLHQAADLLGVDIKILDASLKNAVKLGHMVLLAKNRYLTASHVTRLALAAESLADKTAAGRFTVAEFCEHSETGRNFAISLLEYFDRSGFTERSGNHRHIKRPATTVFAAENETS